MRNRPFSFRKIEYQVIPAQRRDVTAVFYFIFGDIVDEQNLFDEMRERNASYGRLLSDKQIFQNDGSE